MMKKMKAFYPVAVIVVGALLLLALNARAAVNEEARRHMARGQAAVEMARTAADLEDAVKEFRKAIDLAPGWPDPHYDLGLLQERTGKLQEAIASFKEYLRLAPNSPNASKVREQVYKLEYRVEQVLTVPRIIEVLVSGFSSWKDSRARPSGIGSAQKRQGGCRSTWSELFFRREGSDTVKVLRAMLYYPTRDIYQTLKVTGPVLKYITTINVCDEAANKQERGCDSVMENEVEVVSKTLVKVRQRVLRGGSGAGVADGDTFLCEYHKN